MFGSFVKVSKKCQKFVKKLDVVETVARFALNLQVNHLFFSVTSLSCHRCASSQSWSECQDEAYDCPENWHDRCIKFHLKYWEDRESFEKRCGTKNECNDLKNMAVCQFAKKHHDETECKIDCCEGDLCNAGSAAKFSGIMLMACAILSLAFLLQ